jgi:cyanophycinase
MSVDAVSRGDLVIIGGAEDKLGHKRILQQFIDLAGGSSSRIAILATASSLGDSIIDVYRSLFTALGAAEVGGLRPMRRSDANDEAAAAVLDGVTGVFMTGGNQSRLTSVVAGTALGRKLQEANRSGVVVGGTSAGASAISSHMVAFGASGDVPKQRLGRLSAGLGLLPNVIIDQHFGKRNRIGRLLSLVSHSPSLLGIGLDEDTAVVVDADDVLEVLGSGAALIVDGSHIESNAFRAKRYDPLMVSGAILHALPEGSRFDLRSRLLVSAPPEDADERRRAQLMAADGEDRVEGPLHRT